MAGNAVIGALRVTLGADTAQFDEALSGVRARLKGVEKSMQQVGKRMAGVGAVMTAGLTAPLAAFAKTALGDFQKQENAVAAVEAVLKSMGGVAGFTSKQLQDMAANLQAASTFGDEDILNKVTANLLTFGNVQGEVFERAQQSAIDLSARFGKDLQSSAIMLGKALNDPVVGLSALSETGVSFTEQQKEMIKEMAKAGDIAGAQAMILAELEKQYAGQSQAMAETSSGSLAQLNNAWSDFRENIGAIVAEFLPPLVDALKNVAHWLQGLDKDTVKMGVVFGAFAAALGPVVVAVGLVVAAIGAIGIPVAAVIAGVAALSAAWVAFGPEISAVVENTYVAIKTWLLDKMEAVWAGLNAGIDAVKGFFSGMYDAVVGNSWVPDMVTEIAQWFDMLDEEMTKPAQKATEQVSKAFESMGDRIGSILASGVFGGGDIGAGLKDLGKSTLTDLARSAITGKGSFSSLFGGGLAGLFSGVFATGGTIPAGGFGLVGEAGPEFAFAGSKPLNIQPMGGGGATVVINADFRGADSGSEARIMSQLGQLKREIPRMVDNRVLDTNRRKGGY